jgi:hypothetical protein
MVQKIKYTLTSEQDISNKLGQAFSKTSSTEITIQNSKMLHFTSFVFEVLLYISHRGQSALSNVYRVGLF